MMKINYKRMGTVIITTGIIIFLIFTVKNISTLMIEKNRLQKENEKLIEEKKQLTEELENVKDPEYIEEQAKLQLRLIRPGETLYIIDSQGDSTQNQGEEDGGSNNSDGNAQ